MTDRLTFLPTEIFNEITCRLDDPSATMLSMTRRGLPRAKKINPLDIVACGYLTLLVKIRKIDPRTVLETAAMYGRTRIVKWILSVYTSLQKNAPSAATIAATHGHLNTIRYLQRSYGVSWTDTMIYRAAIAGHVHILFECTWLPSDICRYAGTVQVVEYLLDVQGRTWTVEDSVAAANAGRFEVLAHIATRQGVCAKLMFAAKSSAHIEFLHSAGVEWPDNFCTKLAQIGRIDMLTCARNLGCLWDSSLYIVAALNRNLPIIKYARENGLEWPECNRHVDICAAVAGNIEILAYLHENGCPWSSRLYVAAVSCGSLPTIIYAYEHGLEWDPPEIVDLCTRAIFENRLDIVKYLHSRGYPWTTDTTSAAVKMDSEEILKYACDANCLTAGCSLKIMYNCKLAVLEYALDRGCPTDGMYAGSVRGGLIRVLELLRAKNIQWPDGLREIAAAHDRAYMLAHLDRLGYPS